MPIFGRDGDGIAWRPTPDVADATRLAGFLRATGEPSLDALQARAVADPGWFWGAAADDIGIAWDRRPTQVLDLAGGPAWARWWRGGAFDYARAATEPRVATDPDGEALVWDGRPTQVLDLAGGPAWARWWRGGAFDYARAATEPRVATDPDGEALVWEG